MTGVFLVDDSPLIRARLRAMLDAMPGVETVGEADGADAAIAAILGRRPQVVLLDMSLAQGTGFDVLRAVHETAPEVAFYMLSNFATPPYRRLAERLGARGYFDKSSDFERVREVFERKTPCPSPLAC